jgi:murein hydrolase activator
VYHPNLYIRLIGVILLWASPSHSSAPEVTLEETRATMQETEAQQKQADARLELVRKESDALREQILEKAARIDRIEKDILHHERESDRLKKEEATLNTTLRAQSKTMQRLVSSAWSLHHRPQLAAWMLPEQSRERALTARTLSVTGKSLKDKMSTLNDALLQQKALQDTILERAKESREQSQELETERIALQKQLTERQKLVSDIQKEQQRYAEKIAALARDAADLQQLIVSLEANRSAEKDRVFSTIAPRLKPTISPYDTTGDSMDSAAYPDMARANAKTFAQAKGALPLPANGQVIGKYGDIRGKNDHLKGLEIRTLPKAIVTAPFEGEVLYTGDFMDYGNMVIIRHSNDYHTLVAGLSRIDVTKGQFLLDGEPIGAMGEEIEFRKLYMELRQASRTVNPQLWFALTKKHYAKN